MTSEHGCKSELTIDSSILTCMPLFPVIPNPSRISIYGKSNNPTRAAAECLSIMGHSALALRVLQSHQEIPPIGLNGLKVPEVPELLGIIGQ